VVAESGRRIGRTGPVEESLRLARSCYDHLAGRIAVGIADWLVDEGHLVLTQDGGELTDSGRSFFERLGVDLSDKGKRPFCRACLDWSERRYHLAGMLGTRILMHCLESGWIRRKSGNRILDITPLGKRKFLEIFGLRLGR
jgi:hypothetical protein